MRSVEQNATMSLNEKRAKKLCIFHIKCATKSYHKRAVFVEKLQADFKKNEALFSPEVFKAIQAMIPAVKKDQIQESVAFLKRKHTLVELNDFKIQLMYNMYLVHKTLMTIILSIETILPEWKKKFDQYFPNVDDEQLRDINFSNDAQLRNFTNSYVPGSASKRLHDDIAEEHDNMDLFTPQIDDRFKLAHNHIHERIFELEQKGAQLNEREVKELNHLHHFYENEIELRKFVKNEFRNIDDYVDGLIDTEEKEAEKAAQKQIEDEEEKREKEARDAKNKAEAEAEEQRKEAFRKQVEENAKNVRDNLEQQKRDAEAKKEQEKRDAEEQKRRDEANKLALEEKQRRDAIEQERKALLEPRRKLELIITDAEKKIATLKDELKQLGTQYKNVQTELSDIDNKRAFLKALYDDVAKRYKTDIGTAGLQWSPGANDTKAWAYYNTHFLNKKVGKERLDAIKLMVRDNKNIDHDTMYKTKEEELNNIKNLVQKNDTLFKTYVEDIARAKKTLSDLPPLPQLDGEVEPVVVVPEKPSTSSINKKESNTNEATEQDRLAKDAAEKDRLAKEAVEKDRLAKEAEQRKKAQLEELKPEVQRWYSKQCRPEIIKAGETYFTEDDYTNRAKRNIFVDQFYNKLPRQTQNMKEMKSTQFDNMWSALRNQNVSEKDIDVYKASMADVCPNIQ